MRLARAKVRLLERMKAKRSASAKVHWLERVKASQWAGVKVQRTQQYSLEKAKGQSMEPTARAQAGHANRPRYGRVIGKATTHTLTVLALLQFAADTELLTCVKGLEE